MRNRWQKKDFILLIGITLGLFVLGKAGILSSSFVGSTIGFFSPSLGKSAKETLDAGGAFLRGQGRDFTTAKKELRAIYRKHPEWMKTIYCEAEFTPDWKIQLPDGFTYPEKYAERAQRVEWEHMVPAENFGRHFSEWREGAPECHGKKGRECARTNPEFVRMEGDMHNLFPSIGAVNAARSNYRYTQLDHGRTPFGSCQAYIEGRTFSPPEHARGPAARASLYMEYMYQDTIPHLFSPAQKKLFEAWNAKYPPEAWECQRNLEIAKIQGVRNPFIVCGGRE